MNKPCSTPNSACARNAFTGAQIRIGVMGSAAELNDPDLARQCRSLGRAIAEQGCCVLITAHQAFLTHEALSEIARVTLDSVARFRDGHEPVAERVVA